MAGTWTFAEMKAMVKLHLGERTDLSSHTDLSDLYGKWLNSAYLQLTTRNNFWGYRLPIEWTFPELGSTDAQNTVDGTATISAPSDVLFIYTVDDTTSTRKLTRFANMKEYIKLTDRADTNAEGEPTRWIRYGTSIYLHPTPDAVYALLTYYRKKPAVLTGTDTTVIGDEWDEPIVQLATYQSLIRMKLYDDAKVWRDLFIDTISGIVGIYDKEGRDAKRHLKPDPGYFQFGYRK